MRNKSADEDDRPSLGWARLFRTGRRRKLDKEEKEDEEEPAYDKCGRSCRAAPKSPRTLRLPVIIPISEPSRVIKTVPNL